MYCPGAECPPLALLFLGQLLDLVPTLNQGLCINPELCRTLALFQCSAQGCIFAASIDVLLRCIRKLLTTVHNSCTQGTTHILLLVMKPR